MAHPTWDMGPVITINSATLVNKGLELIEAHLLFGVPYADIDVVVHPQSIVHSMVNFVDGATIAQASPPDMRLPIALGLAWPDRLPDVQPALDWTAASTWEFLPLDEVAFPAVRLARAAGEAGGVARRSTTPPTRRRSRRSRRVGCRSQGSSSSSRVPSTTRRTSASPRASRTSWPRRSGPGSTPGDSSPEAELSGLLLTILGIVAFAVGLMFSIGFHEFGHFYWARKFGMRVPQFFVGFGPTVFSRRFGETEFGIKGVPLGGYIRIVGMIPPAEEGESKRATRMRSFIAEVRGQALDDVLPTDGDRVFYKKPWWQRIVVMSAGPLHNLVLAVLFFTIVLTAFGIPGATTTISSLPECVLPADAEVRECPDDAPPSPAAAAGIEAGDTIVAVDGRAVSDVADTGQDDEPTGWGQVQDAIRDSIDTPVVLTVEREEDGATRQLDLTVTPIANTVRVDDDGDGEADGTRTVGYVGVRPRRPTCSSRSPRCPASSATTPSGRSTGWPRSRSASRRCSGPRSWARSATRRGRSASSASAASPARSSRWTGSPPRRRSARSSSCSPG